ncbi:MAG: SUMF1/EgtB/PvdO family nonheme iron enzyme [Rubripirellula sp.]|nr:SUMF1/EgtB/PvdO family nonheme iron enzyme [Rubripirellula sp.]
MIPPSTFMMGTEDAGDADSLLSRCGWYKENGDRTTHPVGPKIANPFGMHDMHGNVWEWCNDWPGSYPSGSVTDPVGPKSGSDRVYRGGSWYRNDGDSRSASRSRYEPSLRFFDRGFRVACVLSGSPASSGGLKVAQGGAVI